MWACVCTRRSVWLWRPSGWLARTVWWSIWRRSRPLDRRLPSVPIKRGPWRRTGWLWRTCGSIIESLRLTPATISPVSQTPSIESTAMQCSVMLCYIITSTEWVMFNTERYVGRRDVMLINVMNWGEIRYEMGWYAMLCDTIMQCYMMWLDEVQCDAMEWNSSYDVKWQDMRQSNGMFCSDIGLSFDVMWSDVL